MKHAHLVTLAFCTLLAIGLGTFRTDAYPRYRNDNGELGSNCSECHGDFTQGASPAGTAFPGNDKHQMHRGMASMATECDLCHTSGDGRNPYIGSSSGTANNERLGCVGCHGRMEDAGNDGISAGLGAGLRQHHTNAGIMDCAICHSDANPVNYTPVGEGVKPPYYDTVDTLVQTPCNPEQRSNVNENWSIGDLLGLDNDGDLLYDAADDDCQVAAECPDEDADGYAICDGVCEPALGDQCGDCNDDVATVNPDGVEGPSGDPTCSDTLDNDCDDLVDAADTDCDAVVVPCEDNDMDGYAACDGQCQVPVGLECGDCDDMNTAVNPGASEGPAGDASCGDGLDNDCDGATDDVDADCAPVVVFCPDGDGDGYAVCDPACELAGGTQCGDCNDMNMTVNPAAAEGPAGSASCGDGLDNDCDGMVDGADPDCVPVIVFCPDGDTDGYVACDGQCEVPAGAQCGDCDDTNSAANPGAVEGPTDDPTCGDGFDNDCDGATDNVDPGCAPTAGFCPDDDTDGYVVCDAQCEVPLGFDCGDCDDMNGSVNPDATEGPAGHATCGDGLDNDCDGLTDDVDPDCEPLFVFCPDDDTDGYLVCDGQCQVSAGYECGDCNDMNGAVNPAATEGPVGDATCSDGLDNDCDGTPDEQDTDCAAVVVFCPDGDGDGYAVCDPGCEPPANTQCGDCNDMSAAVNPDALEGPATEPACADGVDNDCDGFVDEADPGCAPPPLCADGDGDGYAVCDDVCELPVGSDCGDCDDTNPFVHPDAVEGPYTDPTCADGLDNDCDDFTDGDDTSCNAPTLSDYDIVSFLCSHQTRVGKRVSLRLSVENQGATDPGAQLTVYGTREDGTTIPIVMDLEIFAPVAHARVAPGRRTARGPRWWSGLFPSSPGNGRSRPSFTYTATEQDLGEVIWSVELVDQTHGAEDEAEDTASCTTRIRPRPGDGSGNDRDDAQGGDDADEQDGAGAGESESGNRVEGRARGG